MRIGYHASHEQFDPQSLLRFVERAEQAGFDAAMCSDHFSPWSERQGNSGFAWSWLGAALQATQLSFGTVCAPGQRYHPAIVAQAIATLADMYQGRMWVALGSGEFLNEHITGYPWPGKEPRQQRLRESVDVIRRLLEGAEVTETGAVRVNRAKLYVRPSIAPPLYAAALSPETAERAGEWADGLIGAPSSPAQFQEVIAAFRSGGGAGKPVMAQVVVAYASDEEAAASEAYDQWRHSVLGGDALASLATPSEFDQATSAATVEQVREKVLVSSDLQRHADLLREYRALGVDTVYVHNVTRDQLTFIEAYGREVLRAFADDGD